jgi:hypothetical protein
MSEYTVTWTMQVDAESEIDAAMQALRFQRNPESEAVVFGVRPFPGTAPEVAIDLLDHADHETLRDA